MIEVERLRRRGQVHEQIAEQTVCWRDLQVAKE